MGQITPFIQRIINQPVKALLLLFALSMSTVLIAQDPSYTNYPNVEQRAGRLLKVDADNLPAQVDFWVDSLELIPETKTWMYLMLYKSDALIVQSEYSAAMSLARLIDQKRVKVGLDDPHMKFWIQSLMGRYHLLIDERGTALEHLQTALEFAQKAKNYQDQVVGHVQLAEALRPTYKKSKTETHLRTAENLCKKHQLPDRLLAYVYDRSAACSTVISSNKHYSKLALIYAEKSGDLRLHGSSLLQVGLHYPMLSPTQDSLFGLASQHFRAIGDHRNLGLYMINKARFLIGSENYLGAIPYLDSLAQLPNFQVWKNEQVGRTQMCIQVYKGLEIKDSLLVYQDLLIHLLYRAEGKKELDHLYFAESQFEDERQQGLIREQNLSIAQGEARTQWYISLLLIGGLFFAITLFGLIRLRRRKKEIELKNNEISNINSELESSLEENLVLLYETHHRVKNNLQVISSLLESQVEAADDKEVKTAIVGAQSRIGTMAFVHDLLYKQDDHSNLDVGKYLNALSHQVAQFHRDEDNLNVKVNCDNIIYPLNRAVHLGILVNELLTNAHKHARTLDKTLNIEIDLKEEPQEFVLRFQDNGPGLPNGLDSESVGSIGMYLLRSMTRQLRGKMTYRMNNGAEFIVNYKK